MKGFNYGTIKRIGKTRRKIKCTTGFVPNSITMFVENKAKMGQASLFIPDREEVRMWIRESMMEAMSDLREIINSQSKEESPKLLSREEAAEILHMSLPTLNEKTKQDLPSVKVGRKRMYRKNDIEEYIEKKMIYRK